MGKKSRIVPKAPPRPQDLRPQKINLPVTVRPLAEFKRGQKAPLELRRCLQPSGPRLSNHVCVASWDVLVSDAHTLRYLEVAEEIGGVKKLYHGTGSHNVADITREGLHVGNKHCMFGAGIYFGMPEKAINYTFNRRRFYTHEESMPNSAHYIFEAEVALGKSVEAQKAQKYTLGELQQMGCQSVHGGAGYTAGWVGTLHNHEWVVYSQEQVYLLKLHEYQRQVEIRLPPSTSGLCCVLRDTGMHPGRGNTAFKDLLTQKVCGKKAFTQIEYEIVKDGKDPTYRHYSWREYKAWLCSDCLQGMKLSIGSRFNLKPHVVARIKRVL